MNKKETLKVYEVMARLGCFEFPSETTSIGQYDVEWCMAQNPIEHHGWSCHLYKGHEGPHASRELWKGEVRFIWDGKVIWENELFSARWSILCGMGK